MRVAETMHEAAEGCRTHGGDTWTDGDAFVKAKSTNDTNALNIVVTTSRTKSIKH